MQPNLKLLLSLLVILYSIQFVKCTENRLEQLERIVGKLQDTIFMLSKDNANYKRLVEDLKFKVNDQEERIGALEKGCKIETRIASSRATKKRVGYYNDSFNEAFEDLNANMPFWRKAFEDLNANMPFWRKAFEDLNANMPFWRKKAKPNTFMKRTSFSDRGSSENVAFFAYMSQDLSSPSVAHILVFYITPTNIGNHYNKYSGMFTAPRSGTYVFTWTIYCSVGGYVYEQLMVNAEVLDSSYCNADGAGWHRSISGTAVAQINQGDIVYVRTHPTSLNKGRILSSSSHRSSFAGWLLF
uniref:Uncharacterized protein LOC111109875 n=1 Tax=Crassostrea virginica TaxID=6565 RepID=A0A8B8BF34_CRAVI|nr:uncharacterized protein LOC111109875 [Crassostrea virginica]